MKTAAQARGGRPVGFPTPRGFTLIEVIFALAISAVVLAAALSAISMHNHVSTAGRREIEEARLARAIFRMFEIDIRSVAFVPPPGPVVYLDEAPDEEDEELDAELSDGVGGVGGVEGTGTIDQETEPEAALDASAALADGEVGIFGDPLSIVIHADRPARPLEMLRIDPSSVQVGDRQSIAWFLSTTNVPGLASDSAMWFAEFSGDPRSVQGLARAQGTQAAMRQADQMGDIEGILSAMRLVAPEVMDLRFRYFDGLAWYLEWNTAQAQRLPNAVEITLMFRDADEPELAGLASSSLLPRVHRHVVLLPSSAPPVFTPTLEEAAP